MGASWIYRESTTAAGFNGKEGERENGLHKGIGMKTMLVILIISTLAGCRTIIIYDSSGVTVNMPKTVTVSDPSTSIGIPLL